MKAALDIEAIATLLDAMAASGRVFTIAITGSVAAGKSTLAEALKSRLGVTRSVETVSTDGYLFSNARLEAMGLTLRKGYPESYDTRSIEEMLEAVKKRAVAIPGYSHKTYDIDPDLSRTITPPHILIVEGLGLAPQDGRPNLLSLFDAVIYIDAAEDDLEAWFVQRFLTLRDEATRDPSSFYGRFLALTSDQATAFARKVWAEINLPNLKHHISKAKAFAHLVIVKDSHHRLRLHKEPGRPPS